MRTLVDINGYLHDLASAMWICGSILLWMVWRESRRTSVSSDARELLSRLAKKLKCVSVPALFVSLASGAVRAAAFAGYEHVGEVTRSVVITLIAKHVVFTIIVGWGLWIHWKSKAIAAALVDR